MPLSLLHCPVAPTLCSYPSPPRFLPLTETANVAVHPDVVQVVLSCVHLARVALRHILHRKDGLLPILGIVIKVDFGIKTINYSKVDMLNVDYYNHFTIFMHSKEM